MPVHRVSGRGPMRAGGHGIFGAGRLDRFDKIMDQFFGDRPASRPGSGLCLAGVIGLAEPSQGYEVLSLPTRRGKDPGSVTIRTRIEPGGLAVSPAVRAWSAEEPGEPLGVLAVRVQPLCLAYHLQPTTPAGRRLVERVRLGEQWHADPMLTAVQESGYHDVRVIEVGTLTALRFHRGQAMYSPSIVAVQSR